jgi:hypothetical protein
VLGRPMVAWYIIHEAVMSGIEREKARATWLDIVRDDWDRSRRRSLINNMIAEHDDAIVVPLLLDTLGFELPDRWSGDPIVRNLRARGKVVEVRERLNAALANPSVTEEGAATIQRLLEICDE